MPQNTFWIAANIMFDLETGATKQVLLLVNRVQDATVFTEQDAANYYSFVTPRAKNIIWSIERLTSASIVPTRLLRQQSEPRFVIKGVQNV